MLERIFSWKRTIREHREGPLGKYSEKLANKYVDAGYPLRYLRSRFGVVSDLNRWLKRRKLKLREFTPEQVAQFTTHRKKKTGTNFYGSGAHATLQELLRILRADAAIPADIRASRWQKSFEDITEPFRKYLWEEKGFSETALKRYVGCAYQFLQECYGTRHVQLNRLAPENITQFIIRCNKRWSAKHTQLVASALRAFLRFLFVNGDIAHDLSGSIPSIPGWRGGHLPEFLGREEVRILLDACDRRTKRGIRSYVILLLMVRLGLRSSEVLRLTLDDIDWKNGILLVRGKGSKAAKLPLPHDVGKALVAYVKKARPICNSRNLFLRSRAPYRALGHTSSVSAIVRRAIIYAGLTPKHKGSHLLRYTAATECLRRGATLPEVGELLRHRSIDTTAIYAKVDLNRLRDLAQPWPSA